MWKDVAKRRYITVGFTAFVLLDSSCHHFHHRLDSPASAAAAGSNCTAPSTSRPICGVIHYYWLVKSAVLRPLTYRRNPRASTAVAHRRKNIGPSRAPPPSIAAQAAARRSLIGECASTLCSSAWGPNFFLT